MKKIALSKFASNPTAALSGVTDDGDILWVKIPEHGSVVVMEEAEYVILLNALRAVVAVAGSVGVDGKIDVQNLLGRIGN
jgi:hypothetical protein